LKLLSIILCQPQIYRHSYFNINYDKVRFSKQRHIQWCLGMTIVYALLINWYQNSQQLFE
jgi:hypothetical protein